MGLAVAAPEQGINRGLSSKVDPQQFPSKYYPSFLNVYFVADSVIKLFIEDGVEASLYALSTELQFYNLLHQTNSPLKDHIPGVLPSGILFLKEGSCLIIPWDGKGVPELLDNFVMILDMEVDYPFGIWNRQQFEFQKVGHSFLESENPKGSLTISPYLVSQRCRGKIFAEVRNSLSRDDALKLAAFLGEQLRNLHILPCSPFNGSISLVSKQSIDLPSDNGNVDGVAVKTSFPTVLSLYIRTLNKKMKDISSRLAKWGDPIPSTLIECVGEYLPDDFEKFFDTFEDGMSITKPYTRIHSDLMDDNILMKPCYLSSCFGKNASCPSQINNGCVNGCGNICNFWQPCHIIDFSDLSVGLLEMYS